MCSRSAQSQPEGAPTPEAVPAVCSMANGNRPARAATGKESPMTLVATPWWQDRAIVGQFPVLYRLHAYYVRLVRALGRTRGEGFVFRLAGRIHQGVLQRPPSSRVEIG